MKKVITLILEKEFLKEIDLFAKNDQRDRSSWIRKAITEKMVRDNE